MADNLPVDRFHNHSTSAKVSIVQTRELSAEQDTESELDLGETSSPERGSTSRLPFGLSVRGLQGTAVAVGFVTIVTAAVIGGALAVDSVARFDGDRPDGSALLTDGLNGRPSVPEDKPAVEDIEGGGEKATEEPRNAKDETSKPKATGASGNSDKKSGDGAGTESKKVEQVKSKGDTGTPKVRKSAPLAEMGVIRNLATGQCVDLPDAGVPAVGTGVNQYDCLPGATDNQDFQLVEQFGELMIRNLRTNYCLDLPGTEGVDPGAVVVVGPCQAGEYDNQMFRAEPKGGGYYLRHVKSGLCLDVSGFTDEERMRPGAVLTLYTCSPNDDHIWTVG